MASAVTLSRTMAMRYVQPSRRWLRVPFPRRRTAAPSARAATAAAVWIQPRGLIANQTIRTRASVRHAVGGENVDGDRFALSLDPRSKDCARYLCAGSRLADGVEDDAVRT